MDYLRFYAGTDVERLLDMNGCIDAVSGAMAELACSARSYPLREIIAIAPGKLFAVMPGVFESGSGFGSKVVSAFVDPDRPSRSAHRGIVVLFDIESGKPICVADAGAITEIRTGAASAVATDALAPRDAKRLAVFGTGAQAQSHIAAISCVRNLDEILIWGRSVRAGEQLAAATSEKFGIASRFVGDGREAAHADIICTVTSASEPILFGDWIAPGTHINLVGSSYDGPTEVDERLVAQSRYFVDSRTAVEAAGSEFRSALDNGAIGRDHILAEIGDVLRDPSRGRRSADDITVYKSLGHIVQDLAAVAYLHARGTTAAEAAMGASGRHS